jgi:hypothetical protein
MGMMASNSECRSASEWLGATPARGRRSGWWRIQPMAVARRSEPLSALRFTKLDKVFTYDIVASRGSQFAHFGMAADDGGGWRRRGDSAQAQCRWQWAPGLLWVNRGHQCGHRSSVILLGRLIWHWRRDTGEAAS